MAPEISGGLRNSLTATKSKHVLKKGPWTTTEDVILVEYVKKHGEGNWNAVQRNSGLLRCGKSCRLRWANHLRPNLKKGAFTPDEEKLIVDLHAKLGNKWARMAAQLPGRTDNEIKNYWNTRLKRCQRAGLPIYPQQEHSSRRPSNPSPLIYYDSFTSPSLMSPLCNQLKLYGGSLTASSSSFSSNPFFDQGISNPLPMPSMPQYNTLGFGVKTGSDMGLLGLPSIQSSPAATPAVSSSDLFVGTTSSDGEYEVEMGLGGRCKSGLLEDLLRESNALACPEKTEEHFIGGDDKNYEGLNTKASREENSSMDDDLLNLLDNFPLSVPIPDWDEVHGNESPMLSHGTSGAMESQPNGARYNPVATSVEAANQDWNFGSCLWNIMPSIY
ncbi:hypothetical protein CASFOL_020028 [Castilleja foliolosa]|uniref:Uncharacterized protein n=1 Tax=Castilleja foliolosa TaxID=1961234 RepID=A0ABD3CZN4_9LAMI